LKSALDKEFLGFKANQLGKTYKNLADYLTDGGKADVGSPVYNRRMAAYNQFSTQWKGNLNEAGVQSGKLLPAYQQQIEKMYPELAAYINQSPELQKIFRDAVTSPVPVSATVLQARMRATPFWDTLTQARSSFDLATEATRQAAVTEKTTQAVSYAQSLGVSVSASDPKVVDVATKAAREGWSERVFQNAIGAVLTEDDGDTVALRQGFMGTQVNGTMKKWGYPTTGTARQSFTNEWVTKIATGGESLETLNTYLKEQAKTWFPSFAEQFEAGRTFSDVVQPYAQIAANTLEMDMDGIDWSNPIYSAALNQGPEKAGAPMSFNDWATKLRTDSVYGWNSTQQANQLAHQVGAALVKGFGKVR
jgi:hypothetical protein